MTIRTAFPLLVATVVAACSLGGSPVSFDGRDFLSTAVIDGGVERQLVPGTRIRIGFSDGRISASAGCNSMGGSYRVEGAVLLLDGLAMTEMGCDPDRHAQDDWLASFLGARPTARLNGNELALEGGGTIVRLLDREIADPDLSLVGPLWTVDSIVTGDAVSSVPQGAVATLRFLGDGRVEIQPGCNQGGGSVAVGEGTLQFTELVTTDMACGGAAGELEQAVLAVIQTGVPLRYEIEARTLTLMAGANGLMLKGG